MLADYSITGYIASNIVKESTKSAPANLFSLPLTTGWGSGVVEPEHGGDR
jgi:hypothetical protein